MCRAILILAVGETALIFTFRLEWSSGKGQVDKHKPLLKNLPRTVALKTLPKPEGCQVGKEHPPSMFARDSVRKFPPSCPLILLGLLSMLLFFIRLSSSVPVFVGYRAGLPCPSSFSRSLLAAIVSAKGVGCIACAQ
jgi:hypothetical protein